MLLGRSLAGPGRVWSETPGPVAAAPAGTGAVPGFADVVQRAGPAVVAVRAVIEADPIGDDLNPPGTQGIRSGSGFVVDARGLVVTARHLARRALRIDVDLPEQGRFGADLVGQDEVTDLAVLRLVQPPPRLPVLQLGPSEELRAGDWIVAVGNPFGFQQTVTAGIVSYVGRHVQQYDLRVTNNFLQFSAPVNPGSSGCPVLDLAGRVVGVTTRAAGQAQGISFAIPSRMLKWVLDATDKSPDGRAHHGFLGIGFESRRGRDDYGAPLDGAQVRHVAEGEPAHLAGLQVGDVVIYVDEHRVGDAGDLQERILCAAPGTHLRLTLLRGGKVIEPVEVVLREVPTGHDADPPH